jgi:hypothetical protein
VATIDLDAARAARREAKGESIAIRFGGEEFVLPPELPFDVAEHLGGIAAQSGDGKLTDEQEAQRNAAVTTAMVGVMKALLGEQWDGFRKHQPSFDDLQVLLDGALNAYGMGDAGNSTASAES